ncbi:MAG: hypothetical protein H0T51_25220, partial [Pirellulales bacterium]|nr:hypothetical protein [Pirellulales bacterium]
MAHAAAGDIYNLGTFGGLSSSGRDINDAGQVVGYAQDAVGRSRAFLWSISRGMTDLGTANGYTLAGATAINASGSVVGAERDSETGFNHAFAWTPNEPNGTTGTFIDLAHGEYSTAADINAAGQVVGSSTYYVPEELCTPDYPNYPNCAPAYYETRAILWANGDGVDLTSTLHGDAAFILTTANAINNAGQVAGQSSYYGVVHAFLYGGGNPLHELGTVGTTISAINDAGQVIGDSWTSGGGGYAFRYTGTSGSGGVTVELGSLGGSGSHADDINDAG